jgi:indolepyruvate decarboxylase
LLNNDSVIVADSSLSIFPLSNVLVDKNQFISQIGWSSFGYSMSAAIGVELSKKRPIIFIGDGGFQTSFRSLVELKKFNSKAIVFLFNNGTNSLGQWKENPIIFKNPKDEFDQHNIVTRWDYEELIESIGGEYFNLYNISQLKETLVEIEHSTSISLLVLNIDSKDIPMMVKWKIQ